uniref:Uncharacterized protein n=1 Tax=Brassica oleracea var. oleracea TaxID=109376 RepID=A0A0D3BFS3_BRAOL
SEDEPRPAARLRRSSVSSSRASGSSHKQNSVPAYIPALAPAAPPATAQQDPGVMPVQEFNWHSDLTETVRKKFNEKAMDSYTKQINAWKTVWQKNKRPRFINGTKEETTETSSRNSKNRKSDHGGKGMYVHNLGACSMSTKEDELIEANDGNPVDRLQLIKVAHTNKTTGQIQDPVIKGVVDLVEAEIELHDKDERIGALEEQNTTILSENATIRSENSTILAELAS